MRLLCTATAFISALLAMAVVSAADPVRVEVLSLQEQAGTIMATIVVYGPDGQPVANLSPDSIRATLDGKALGVSGVQSMTTSRPPLSVVLVVDVSGSMLGEPITQARRALGEFVGSLEPNDEVALMAFDTSVRVIEDFTVDKARATQALGRLTPLGDTALYDAVIQATQKASEAKNERRIVVLLTDGIATVNLDRRADSIAAAQNSGVAFVPIGLGTQLDRPYLNELADVTGGHYLEAPSPAALRQAYADLAAAIRTQYTVTFAVPAATDRTVPSKLAVTTTVAGQSATIERTLPPLAGAAPPTFELNASGIVAGSRLQTPVSIEPSLPQDLAGKVTVEFQIDGERVFSATAPPYSYKLDPAELATGSHTLTIVARDERGRRGETQVGFVVVAPAKSGGPQLLLLLAVLVVVSAAIAYLLVRRHWGSMGEFVDRTRPWRPSTSGGGPAAKPVASEWSPRELPPMAPPVNRVLGRVIVVDEAAIKKGNLSAFREYPIGVSPLTLGTTSRCDIIVEDPQGFIAGEEARLWVQRDRLVYHKLTTLSAMATEGVTSGWQFLESGEEVRVGPYRIAFELDVAVDEDFEAEDATASGRPQGSRALRSGPGALRHAQD